VARPMTSDQFLRALTSERLQLEEHPAWKTHNRNRSGAVRRQWGPLHGVMIHHTATGEEGIVRTCCDGRPDLPGPLCHGVIHKSGLVTLVGCGRANHAGLGDARVLSAVIREKGRLPRPGRGTVDGNPHFVGYELVNKGDGKDPWPAEQYKAAVQAAAAVCRFYRWTSRSVIAHREWTSLKPDPVGIDMNRFRADVQAQLKRRPVRLVVPPRGLLVVRDRDNLEVAT
jgi:N-acetylmuramoyl-L-alanine amidase-like protein